jgi:protein-tyrosine phosphatase
MYLETAFTEMRGQFGTMEDYFAKGLGIDRAGQQTLRERFVERQVN